MGGNGLTIANNGADIEFTDGVDTYGFKLALNNWLTETRGSAYVGNISSGGSTYQDAEPWKRKVYDNFLGGMGQLSDNKVTGGTGIGGDDSKYFYADAKTDRAGYLLPGMRRNMVYNTIAGQVVPVAGDLNPNAGDEYEIPMGVMPLALKTNRYWAHNSFTTTAAGITGITTIRVLVNLVNSNFNSTYTLTGSIYNAGVFFKDFTYNVNPATAANTFNGWTWVNLTATATNFAASTTYDVFFQGNDVFYPNIFAIGCYSNYPANSTGSASSANINPIRPYFQLCKPGTTTPYKWWANPLQKVEQVISGGVYVNVGISTTSHFNMALTNSGGTAPATSPECSNGGTYTSSIVFNNQLYIGTSGGIAMWNAAACAANTSASTAAAGAAFMNSPVELGGKIYYIDSTGTAIFRWDGTFPVTGTNSPQVAAAGFMGTGTSIINRLFVFQGNLWVLKPEGLFQLYIDPAIMDLNPGNTPRIVPIVNDLPSVHADTGKWVQIHQGMIYFNYRDRIYQVVIGTSPQVSVFSLPMPWYRRSYFDYVNGIASDGTNLYVSWNNLGVFQYTNQVWHPVTEFYETVAVESQASGLRWVPNPTGGADSLFVGDGRAVVQLPIPNASSPYTRQFALSDQNKCGYFMTSFTNMEQAEIPKFVQSVVVAAFPSYFRFKVVPVVQTPEAAANNVPNATQSATQAASWAEGLTRDSWLAPSFPGSTNLGRTGTTADVRIATTKYGSGWWNLNASTTSPACWDYTDFSGTIYSSEKFSYRTDTSLTIPEIELLTTPAKFVQTQFIVYFWCPIPNQSALTNNDIMAVDSMVVKYQAIQDYLAQYQGVIDFHGKVSGTDSTSLTTQQIEDSYDWLRSQTGRHSPLRVTFRVRKTGTTTRSFYFLPQNPNWLIDPTVTNNAVGDPAIKSVGLQMIASQSEYPNV